MSTPPGPLAEEAARLVEALGQWARDATGGASLRGIGGSAECQLCPFCQLLALARRTQPETFGHLADASASLLAALRTVVAEHNHGNGTRSGVERIDLDERDDRDDLDRRDDQAAESGPAAPNGARPAGRRRAKPSPTADAAT